jgi:hypothetical protein
MGWKNPPGLQRPTMLFSALGLGAMGLIGTRMTVADGEISEPAVEQSPDAVASPKVQKSGIIGRRKSFVDLETEASLRREVLVTDKTIYPEKPEHKKSTLKDDPCADEFILYQGCLADGGSNPLSRYGGCDWDWDRVQFCRKSHPHLFSTA